MNRELLPSYQTGMPRLEMFGELCVQVAFWAESASKEVQGCSERGRDMAAEGRAFMRIRASLLRFLFATILAGLVGFSVGTSNVSAATATVPDVSAIPNQVQHELAMLPWYGVFDHLAFQVNGTEVILSGQVISEHATTKDDAEKFVKSIHGVTRVVNNIEVLPPSRFDDQIRRAEFRTVFSQADLGRYTMGAIPQVHIIVKNGHVSLEGVVMNQMDKNMARIFANSVPGVFSVENNLRIG